MNADRAADLRSGLEAAAGQGLPQRPKPERHEQPEKQEETGDHRDGPWHPPTAARSKDEERQNDEKDDEFHARLSGSGRPRHPRR